MWTVEFAADAERDLELIFDHLVRLYQEFGEGENAAFDHAADRVQGILGEGRGIATAPHQGTLRPDILDGVRVRRRDKAAFWFVLDEGRAVVQILAVFYGGQNHVRHMMTRILRAP